ncbi:glycoprotein-N-acetylgalactosamine 3-beta-galactosyltransferase 1-like [Penaeus monodon]|uniref:glycoprotein-N-acetylgalactosamine 3-beta-galactosyltransferase 1-like n=1 Tax=Penaeus monodon TaxID=6687 RepID=UPI0018A7A340|nr:glycoprotein-N-acetylgalactosamine 3-beta-galactosyltransferase 1-like [Penaeus monodon]
MQDLLIISASVSGFSEICLIPSEKMKHCDFFSYFHFILSGAGYVLGREALRRFIEKALHNEAICGSRRYGEDFQLGRCLQAVGVAIVDTRDHRQQGRFFQQHVRQILQNPDIHSRIVYYPIKKDGNPDSCCSDTVISFHQMSVADLYMLDYLIYKVRVFGYVPSLPLKVPLPPDLEGVPNRTLQKYLL